MALVKPVEERMLLEKALEALRQQTGLHARVEAYDVEGPYGYRQDARLQLRVHGKEMRFAVELKRRLTNTNLGAVVHQITRYPEKALLVADYVNPNLAERLKEMNIAFIDTVGNAYFNEPPLFVYLKGHGPAKDYPARPRTRAFQPTGLKVLFAFFCKPELMNAPYRNIAKVAGVALGTIGWVLRDLRELGYLTDMGKHGRKWAQNERLIDRWAAAYVERLRPNLLIGRFTAPNPNWWRHAQIRELQAYWGGEVAAARLTHYLKPQVVTIYARDPIAKLQLNHKLKTDRKGNVEIFKLFWNLELHWGDADIVHPLLVYADLLATADPRNMEIAKTLYAKHVAQLVGED